MYIKLYTLKILQFCHFSIRLETLKNKRLKKDRIGLPWWLSGKVSACQCRRHRFHPWSLKIPHATDQLSPVHHNCWACALEPRGAPEPTCCNHWSPDTLEPGLSNRRSPHPATGEKPAQQQRVSTAKNKYSFCLFVKGQNKTAAVPTDPSVPPLPHKVSLSKHRWSAISRLVTRWSY